MGRFFPLVERLDRLGLRRPLASVASLAYRGSRFSVDPEGRWINAQEEATFASPSLHTARYRAVQDWVLENWLWDRRPREGDTVIDVGAGIGEETVVFSRLVGPAGRVISIEAHPDTFACLEATVRRSNLSNVTLIQCAITDRDGTISISTADCHVASSVMSGGEVEVAARSLDSLAEERALGEIGFLKMNIEGAERLAMEGMKETLGKLRTACISCHDFIADLGGSDDFRSRERVRRVLTAAGFAIRTRPDHPQCWVRDYLYASK